MHHKLPRTSARHALGLAFVRVAEKLNLDWFVGECRRPVGGRLLEVSGRPIARGNPSVSEVIQLATCNIVLHRKSQNLAKGVDEILTANGVSLEVTDVIVCRE